MADFFFFAEYDRLLIQANTDAFGPDSTTPSNKFNFTSVHSNDPISGNTNLKAFAVCDGQILIQAIPDYANSINESNYVNIILKPNYQGNYDFQNIRYFVYRNILKSSIIDPDNIRIAPANTTDLTNIIWTTQNAINASKDSAEGNAPGTTTDEPNKKLSGINFTANISNSNTVPPSDIKADNQSFDDLFFNNQDNFTAPRIKAGEIIGFFDASANFGFDIIMDGYREPVKFGDLRRETNSITVSALPGSPTKIQIFTDKKEREKILTYFDPCTFFASFYNGTLFAKDSSGTKTAFSGVNLYTTIISKFENKNKVYIDIRNENDLSYDYYDNYPNLKLKINNGSSATLQYKTLGWPILMLGNSDFSGTNNNGVKNNLILNLPNGDNSNGLVYLANAYVTKKYPKKRKGSKKFIPLTYTSNFSQDVNLSIPNASNTLLQVSSYIKLNYIKRNQTGTPVNTTVFPTENFLENLFYPFIPISFWSSTYNTKFALGSYQKFVDAKADLNFSAIVETGYASEGSNVILYAIPKDIYEHRGHRFTNIAPVTSGNTDNVSFLNHIQKVIAGFRLIKQQLTISGNPDFYLEFVVNDESGKVKYKKENLLAVCITSTEFAAIQNVMSNFNTQIHPVFLLPLNVTPSTDDNGKYYLKIDWTVAGLDNNANYYSYPAALFTTKSGDKLIHSSSSFASVQQAPIEQAKISLYLINEVNLHQWTQRLSIFEMPKVNWELYDLNGLQKTYEPGDIDWDGSSLSGANINLAVGTRVIRIGSANISIGNESNFEFIVFWYKGRYREGLVSKKAFVNSNEVRVNLADYRMAGNSILREPFLNDCDQWISYLDAYFSYNIQTFTTQGQPNRIQIWNNSVFKTVLDNIKNKFNASKSLSIAVLNTKLETLSANLYTKDLLSATKGNFVSNTDNFNDTVERWLNNSTFQTFLTEKQPGANLEVPRMTSKWIRSKLIDPNEVILQQYYVNHPDAKKNITNLCFLFTHYSSGNTAEAFEINYLKDGLQECKSILSYISSNYPSTPVLLDPNVAWINSVNLNQPSTYYIIMSDDPFYVVERNGLYAEGVGIDSSFGYLNTDTAFSVFLHECNVSSFSNPGPNDNIFKSDTHMQPTDFYLNGLKDHISTNNYSSLEYFNLPVGQLKLFNPNKLYHFLFNYNPFVGAFYLNYFFNKM